uniref:G-protein coupled receptors family 3 profile domain-containing protein n=1 Tax=Ditylum brightwellii TaxID=49249 RepID=A0A6V2K2C7_9STRA
MGVGEDGSCHIAALLPFTEIGMGGNRRKQRRYATQHAFSNMAAALMAMEDFNARDSRIVPELSDDEFTECDVKLSLSVLDDGSSNDFTVSNLLNHINDMSGEICGIAGVNNNFAAREAAVLGAAFDVPYITHAAETSKISRTPLYRLSAKISADEFFRADALIKYLASIGRTHIMLVYSAVHEDIIRVITLAGKENGVDVRTEIFQPPFASTGVGSPLDAMRRVKESGFRTIVLAPARVPHLVHIAQAAQDVGIDTDEYLWFAYDVVDLDIIAESVKTQPGDPLDNLYSGMGSVRTLDGFAFKDDDAFLQAWKENDKEFVSRLNTLNPIAPQMPGFIFAQPNYFQDERNFPILFSSFMYDTVVALGMGACRARNIMINNGTSSPLQIPQQVNFNPGLNLQYNETVKLQFQGASGMVNLLDGFSYTRDIDTFTFGAYNVRPKLEFDEMQNVSKHRYEYFLTSQRLPGEEYSEINPFIYADGRTTPPSLQREAFENNFLSSGIRATGLSLVAIGIAINLIMATWVFINRKKRPVRVSQPLFLGFICFGSITSLISIILISFDESYGVSATYLGKMCNAALWFFFLGYLIVYSTIFSKLWRINKVLSLRRRVVKPIHVAAPATILITCAIIVLVVWVIVDPLKWDRQTIDDFTGETFGRCSSRYVTVYISVLTALCVIATFIAGIMAYKCKDISDEFAETRYIFTAILTQVQVWIIGIPIIILVNSMSVNATYIAKALLVFIFAVSVVLLVIGPKILSSLGIGLGENNRKRGKFGSKDKTSKDKAGDNASGVHVSGFNPPSPASTISGVKSTVVDK